MEQKGRFAEGKDERIKAPNDAGTNHECGGGILPPSPEKLSTKIFKQWNEDHKEMSVLCEQY